MDVLEIDGASNRGIDEIRNLRELVKYPPINGKYKIFIIDEVHMLTVQAFNALLKTLEEPPPHVKFVFATTEPNKVLPTILSRCQRHDFHRLSLEDILSGLNLVLEKEDITIDDKTKQIIVRLADGSMRDALSLLDQIIAFCGNEVTFEQASSLLRIIPDSLFFDITDAIKDKNHKQLLNLVQSVYSEGYSLNVFVSKLNQHFLNFLVCKAESGRELLDVTEETLQRYENESQKWDARDILRYTDLVAEMESKLKIVQQPKIYVETMMLKILEMDSTISINDLISRISSGSFSSDKTESGLQQANLFAHQPSKKATESPEPATQEQEGKINPDNQTEGKEKSTDRSNSELFEAIKKQWEEVIAKVSENGTSISTFLDFGHPSALKGKRLIISFPQKYKFHLDFLKKNVQRIESTVEKVMGRPLKIDFIVSKNAPASKNSKNTETHPVTKRMLELFGGKIVE